ncbi:MAG: hypothetical protein EZS28_035080 [Streblomastix strix]|uniref:EF-hand domain-containing protein n=1 Tax=Streblomastix strix TaxID=222440 RepID=A0A5J4UGN8_9EUKA|nr:MAG: hypothetical protein EZS28_035080 [Streblomastix strix]
MSTQNLNQSQQQAADAYLADVMSRMQQFQTKMQETAQQYKQQEIKPQRQMNFRTRSKHSTQIKTRKSSLDELPRNDLEKIVQEMGVRAKSSGGYLEEDDFTEIIKKYVQMPPYQLHNIFIAMDTHGSGQIEWNEIANFVMNRILTDQTVERLEYHFNQGRIIENMCHKSNIELMMVISGEYASNDQLITCGRDHTI